MGCVYLSTNRINGKQYVGKTVKSLSSRKQRHVSASQRGSRYYFHNAIRKYGIEAFNWSVLFQSDCEDVLHAMEREFIQILHTKIPEGYNATDGGEGTCGRTCSDETVAKMRESHKGQKGSCGFAGKHHSAEARAKISLTSTGRRHSPQTRAKMSLAMTGLKRSPESCARISAARKGAPVTAKQRAAAIERGAKRKGIPMSPETKAKLSAAHRGKTRSLAHREHCRVARNEYLRRTREGKE